MLHNTLSLEYLTTNDKHVTLIDRQEPQRTPFPRLLWSINEMRVAADDQKSKSRRGQWALASVR
jgi:hypothetical protein